MPCRGRSTPPGVFVFVMPHFTGRGGVNRGDYRCRVRWGTQFAQLLEVAAELLVLGNAGGDLDVRVGRRCAPGDCGRVPRVLGWRAYPQDVRKRPKVPPNCGTPGLETFVEPTWASSALPVAPVFVGIVLSVLMVPPCVLGFVARPRITHLRSSAVRPVAAPGLDRRLAVKAPARLRPVADPPAAEQVPVAVDPGTLDPQLVGELAGGHLLRRSLGLAVSQQLHDPSGDLLDRLRRQVHRDAAGPRPQPASAWRAVLSCRGCRDRAQSSHRLSPRSSPMSARPIGRADIAARKTQGRGPVTGRRDSASPQGRPAGATLTGPRPGVSRLRVRGARCGARSRDGARAEGLPRSRPVGAEREDAGQLRTLAEPLGEGIGVVLARAPVHRPGNAHQVPRGPPAEQPAEHGEDRRDGILGPDHHPVERRGHPRVAGVQGVRARGRSSARGRASRGGRVVTISESP